MRIILLGAPGSGKGTLASRLAREFKLAHIATGDILRRAVEAGSVLGREVEAVMNQGGLVPDTVMVDLIADRLAQPDAARGFILDGFPRTVAQAMALDKLLDRMSLSIDHVFHLNVPEEDLVKRSVGRRVCSECGRNYHLTGAVPRQADRCDECGGELRERDDDGEDTVRRRLKVYQDSTRPLAEYYGACGAFREVDGTPAPDVVYHSVTGWLRGTGRR
ncbi:MAG TPA: adenylate kinase [Clostridiales bacterium]|nr:adenylate kinase [Clostridiales bacterium]